MLITDIPGHHTKTNKTHREVKDIHYATSWRGRMRPGYKLLSHSWKVPQVTRKNKFPAPKKADFRLDTSLLLISMGWN